MDKQQWRPLISPTPTDRTPGILKWWSSLAHWPVSDARLCEFARRRAQIGLVARGEDGLCSAARSRACRRPGPRVACRLPQPDSLESVADEVEKTFGPIDVWVNDAMVFGLFSVPRDDGRRISTSHRSDVPGVRIRHARGPAAHGAAGPRHGRPGRLGPGLPGDPPAIGVLRCENMPSRDSPNPSVRSCCT